MGESSKESIIEQIICMNANHFISAPVITEIVPAFPVGLLTVVY